MRALLLFLLVWVAPVSAASSFFKTHILVFFYASTCPYCHQLAPHLKHWAQRHRAEVLALALDNQPLPAFPDFSAATADWVQSAFQGQAIRYPALFVFNSKKGLLYPVSIGSLDEQELSFRLKEFTRKIKAYEEGNS